MLEPLKKMLVRIDNSKEDSDVAFFNDLLLCGELVLKTVVLGLVSAIDDDRDRNRYKNLHTLVRADGIGKWSEVLEEVLSGPSSRFLKSEVRKEQNELNKKVAEGNWQYQSVKLLHDCLSLIEPQKNIPKKVEGKKWHRDFAYLRNKTRGHGAIRSSICSDIAPLLEESIMCWINNFGLFAREWAYLHRNLSGKYRVTYLNRLYGYFEEFKKKTNFTFKDGVYYYAGEPIKVELLSSDVDASDFYYVNGHFNENNYEMLSYITGEKISQPSSAYLYPIGSLPTSETEGKQELTIKGECFSNIPELPDKYVRRISLECDLESILLDDHHPIITLEGRGGIGKTSLALKVLHEVVKKERYDSVIWFSARDIDLLPEGPKQVKPKVLSKKHIAEEYARLFGPIGTKGSGIEEYFSNALTDSGLNGKTLFVFDNFETVSSPNDLFVWLDTYIRNPNKILITTRERKFKGDYPIEVTGMTEEESAELIDTVSKKLGIYDLITKKYKKDLHQESEGHPYVIKILLGEVAKSRKLLKPEKILASMDDILIALFERTYNKLTPGAQRVFLTLSNWRSTIPYLALEATLLCREGERMDVTDSIDSLLKSSFIEEVESDTDSQRFLSVPLVASEFGRKKLSVNPMKSVIQADIEMLRLFGPSQITDVKHGLKPRIERLVRSIARIANEEYDEINKYSKILEFIARRYSPAWLEISKLYEEIGTPEALEKSKEAVRSFLESRPSEEITYAWKKLIKLCKKTNDIDSEVHAIVEMCSHSNVEIEDISEAANRINSILANREIRLDSDEKQIIVRQLVEVMEQKHEYLNADDLSRLAWLCLHLKEEEKAKDYVCQGLEKEPDNSHCLNLYNRLRNNN